MKEINATYVKFFDGWKCNNLSSELIMQELSLKGYSNTEVEEIITLYKKKCDNDRMTKGFIMMGAGAFLGFISCVCVLLDFGSLMRDIFLYGLTSVSVIIAMAGLYLVFEGPGNAKA